MPGRQIQGKLSAKRRCRPESYNQESNSPTKKKQKTDFVDLQDDFSDEFFGSDNSFTEICGKMNKTDYENPNSGKTGKCCREASQPDGIRFKVKKVDRMIGGPVHLQLQEEESTVFSCCTLLGFWRDTFVKLEDTVNVIADFVEGCAIVDDSSGLLVVDPDRLVNITSVTSAFFCKRKAVLADIFRGWDKGNEAMVLGNLVHRLFQVALVLNLETDDALRAKLKEFLKEPNLLTTLYSSEIALEKLEAAAMGYVPEIVKWVEKYRKNSQSEIRVTKVVDIEESIWCPRYGIKGKIDASLRVVKRRGEAKVVPLELKTGKASFSTDHQGQVILYNMMMGGSGPPTDGLLLYLNGGPQMQEIVAPIRLQSGLVQMRNELALHTTSFDSGQGCFLPHPINRPKACLQCSYLLPCTALKRCEGEEEQGMDQSLVSKGIGHLSQAHLDYFSHWFNLLRMEHSVQEKAYFWLESPQIRESKGNCLSSMRLSHVTSEFHTFRRRCDALSDTKLSRVGFSVGDRIVVSIQEDSAHIGVASGSLQKIDDDSVCLLLERDLERRWKGKIFRLDRICSSSAINYLNVLRLMDEDAARLRRLVVDREKAVFEVGLSKKVALCGRNFLRPLNKVQQRAVLKAVMAHDYLLIRGMPGAGKTSTVVAMIQLFVALEQSVLLTSHTNSAVDNVLLKLNVVGVPFIRIGARQRVHPDVRKFIFDVSTTDIGSTGELDSLFHSKPVVAVTCYGIRDPVFAKRRFDVCIVDEATQVVQATCLGPLFHAKKFCLLGDPKQLPPVVKSRDAMKLGLDESLFCRLESCQEPVDLNVQYRMNREILRLCNELTYGGRLACGSEEVEHATVAVSVLDESNTWISRVLSPRLENSVIFCDTDALSVSEEHCCNQTESLLINVLVSSFIKGGVNDRDMGIVTPFRNQVQLLQSNMTSLDFAVEVNTVDQYQGRDKSVIIMSCVRNRPVPEDILEDERRLNVALTRAKHKLVIVGSRRTLVEYSPFRKLLAILRPDQVLSLPTDACQLKTIF